MKARFQYVATVLMALVLWGCVADHEDVSDDDTLVSDNDVSDDDTGKTNPEWAYFTIEVRFAAAGGANGGPAGGDLRAIFHDAEEQVLCHQSIDFVGEYSHGVGQSAELFDYTDQLVVLDQLVSTNGDCPHSIGTTLEEITQMLQWTVFPLAFVSCASVAANPDLGAMELVEWSWVPEYPPWTFEHACDRVGEDASDIFDLGEVEAIWLRPCSEGEFDDKAGESLVYFVPGDTSHTEAWALFGFSHAGADNNAEPTEGLEGSYDVSSMWPLVFGVGE